MKKLILIIISIVLSLSLSAQNSFEVPVLSAEQEMEVLYNHTMAYALCGVSFAKSQNVSPANYGVFIGKQFTTFWNPEDGFPAFANTMMYLLAGIHHDNQMEIINQSDKLIKFQLKNVNKPFENGDQYGVSLQEYLSFSDGIISTLADYMKSEFTHKMTDDWWYVVTIKSK